MNEGMNAEMNADNYADMTEDMNAEMNADNNADMNISDEILSIKSLLKTIIDKEDRRYEQMNGKLNDISKRLEKLDKVENVLKCFAKNMSVACQNMLAGLSNSE